MADAGIPESDAPRILVDADACPVKEEVIRVAARYGAAVHLVSNQWQRGPDHALVRRVVVPGGFDAADDWIAGRAGPRDVVITADIRLAARCLEKGAQVLGPSGKPFTGDGIGMALAMRELMATLRDTGEVRGGGPAFTRQDRSRFLQALDRAMVRAQRQAGEGK